MIIFSRCKSIEEMEFYLNLCIKEAYAKRELDRQISASIYERTMIGNTKLSPVLRETHPDAINQFKDNYSFECADKKIKISKDNRE
jgi:predicted nuclease of restriction endonuclease-like (RecB) superfamily